MNVSSVDMLWLALTTPFVELILHFLGSDRPIWKFSFNRYQYAHHSIYWYRSEENKFTDTDTDQKKKKFTDTNADTYMKNY